MTAYLYSGQLAIAAVLRREGYLAAAQAATAAAINLAPSAGAVTNLYGDWRSWEHSYRTRRSELQHGAYSTLADRTKGVRAIRGGAKGISYQSSLLFPFSGRDLRALADLQAAQAVARKGVSVF